jgi:hypothetical protein
MKKYFLLFCIFSIIQFHLDASDYRRDNLMDIDTDITKTDIDNYYNGFLDHTGKQAKLLKQYSWLGDRIMSYASTWYGYDSDSRRLIALGDLVLDKNWKDRVDTVLLDCNDDDLLYVNGTKNHVLQSINKKKYGTKDALNQAISLIHECHVNELQKREFLNEDMAALLRKNDEKIDGHYPIYNYINQYKNEHGDELPRTVVLNMFLTYLFALYKVTSKGS